MDGIAVFEESEAGVDEAERADPLWRMAAYRLARYAIESAWPDVQSLDRVRGTRAIAPQLYDAIGSIAANIAEGYSRSSGPDRVRLFEYALGSVRESIVWYVAARPVLGPHVYNKRVATLTSIRKLLLAAIPAERSRRIGRRQ